MSHKQAWSHGGEIETGALERGEDQIFQVGEENLVNDRKEEKAH